MRLYTEDPADVQSGFASTSHLPVIDDPWGKTNEAWNWVSFFPREFLVRENGLCPRELNTHRSKRATVEYCGRAGSKAESAIRGWRVRHFLGLWREPWWL